jgi:hypothetical protein
MWRQHDVHKSGRYLPVAILAVGGGLGVLSVLGEGSFRALTILVNLASPWAFGAFMVGRLASSPKLGALAGGLTLVVGMATFYGLTVVGPYTHSLREVVWTVGAVLVGPVMGMSGAVLSSGQVRWREAAIVIPSAILLAEALWIGWDRRVWVWNLRLEPQRLNDLVILVGFIALAFAFPLLFMRNGGPLLKLYLATVVAGAIGAGGFASLQWILLHV